MRRRHSPHPRLPAAAGHQAGASAGPAPADEQALLRLARSGDLSAAGHLCDHHVTALFSLALAILGDRERAAAVVVDVVADACTRPGDDQAGMTVRHGLARTTYLRCVPRPAQTDLKRAGRSAAASSGQSVPARTRRAVLALVLVGDHTYVDAADLLGLPRLTVTGLLVSFLRDGHLGAEDQRSSAGPSRRQHARASNVRTHDESD